MLLIDGCTTNLYKLSKSLGNIYTVTDLKEKGYNPMSFKYFCLQTYYGKKINFTFETLKASQTALIKLHKLLNEHKESSLNTAPETLQKYENEFLSAINDDLNTPLAIGIIWTMLKSEAKSKDIYNLVIKFDNALGLNLDKELDIDQGSTIPENISALAEERWAAKKAKNWTIADAIRNELKALGYEIKDTAEGYEINKI